MAGQTDLLHIEKHWESVGATTAQQPSLEDSSQSCSPVPFNIPELC
jgi:hypothetical protein